MQAGQSIMGPTRARIAACLIASLLLPDISAAIAQGGGFEKLPPSVAPTPYSGNGPSNSTGPEQNQNTGPTYTDHPNPPSVSSSEISWGAIAFTADGSYSSTWKMASQPEAEAKVLRQCARFGRGGCEVVSFSGQECAALATFIGPYRRRRWSLSFTAGGMTYPSAQNAAMDRCNSDERTQRRCQPRTTACADGR
jgi:Domain of unknown function (DUF4189)